MNPLPYKSGGEGADKFGGEEVKEADGLKSEALQQIGAGLAETGAWNDGG